jgi:4-amino-4-deoxy-L-arabinose transferase-like glycosyltransferase
MAAAASGGTSGWPRLIGRSWVVPAVFGLALLLRVALILVWPQQPVSDASFYVSTAAEIAAGRGYHEGGVPTAFWPVGYPALLAGGMTLFGPSLLGPMLLNLAGAAAILSLILWFGRRCTGSETAARTAALLYAVYPAHIAYTGAVMSETTYMAVVMAAFALLIAGRASWGRLLLAGLLFAIATLMRTQTLLFPAGAIILLAWAEPGFRLRQAGKAMIAVHLVIAAVVLPWSLRNERVLGEFVLVSTNGGVALYTGANPAANGDYFAEPWEHGPLWNVTGIPFEQRVERQIELDRRFKDLAVRWIAEDPLRWATLGMRKMVLLWARDSDGFWMLKRTYPALERPLTAVQWLNQLFYLALLALGGWGFLKAAPAMLRRHEPGSGLVLLLAMPVFCTLLAFVFTGQSRYHYPAMPFVIVAAGWTIARSFGALKPARAAFAGRDIAPAAH